jgi:hypothetical protein
MEINQQTWADYNQLNGGNSKSSKTSAPPQYFNQFVSKISGNKDKALFYISILGFLFFITGSVYCAFKLRALLFPVLLLFLCTLGIHWEIPRVLFHLKFPTIQFFRQWYHFGPVLILSMALVSSLGFYFLLDLVKKFNKGLLPSVVMVAIFTIISVDLLHYGCTYQKLFNDPYAYAYNKRYSKLEFNNLMDNSNVDLSMTQKTSHLLNFSDRILIMQAVPSLMITTPKFSNKIIPHYYQDTMELIKAVKADEFFHQEQKSLPYVYFKNKAKYKEIVNASLSGIQNTSTPIQISNTISPQSANYSVYNKYPGYISFPINSANTFSCYLNKKKIKPFLTNGNFVGVFLPAGPNLVQFNFQTNRFNLLIFSQYFIIVCILCIVVFPTRNQPNNNPTKS